MLCGPRTMTTRLGTPIGAFLRRSEASSVGRGRSPCGRGDTRKGPDASGRAGRGSCVTLDADRVLVSGAATEGLVGACE